jgi:hypothetical protein
LDFFILDAWFRGSRIISQHFNIVSFLDIWIQIHFSAREKTSAWIIRRQAVDNFLSFIVALDLISMDFSTELLTERGIQQVKNPKIRVNE